MGHWGCPRGHFFSNMVMWHIKLTGMTSKTEYKYHLHPRVKLVTLGLVKRSNIINMSISRIFIPNSFCVFSQIKDRKHIEQNFHSVARVMPRVGLVGAGGVKNFSVGICDGAPSTVRSSFKLLWQKSFQLIHNLLSPILFIFCPETVVCFHICCI